MKQFLLLRQIFTATILLSTYCANAQWVSIPDTNFGKYLNDYLLGSSSQCMRGSNTIGWELDTTCYNLKNDSIRGIDGAVSNMHHFKNFDGLQYFRNLKQFGCYQVNVDTINEWPSGLRIILFASSTIGKINSLPPSLRKLSVGNCGLSSFPTLPDSLIELVCSANNFSALPPLPNSLQIILCGTNPLTQLPQLPLSLKHLDCWNSQLTHLPSLPPALYELTLSRNNISSLPELPASLRRLFISYNPISCLPSLPALTDLHFDSTLVECIPNVPANLQFSNPPLNSLPLCSPINANTCNLYWNAFGKVFIDKVPDCLKDTTETPGFNVKLMLSEMGAVKGQSYTTANGDFSLDADLGNYDVEIDTTDLPLTVYCPSGKSYSIQLTPLDSMKTGLDFGLRCKAGFDVGVLSAIKFGGILFPAQQANIYVAAGDLSQFYGLNCAAGVSGALSITYSGPVSFAGAMSGALAPTVSGNTLTYTIADFGAIDMQTAFGLRFLVDTFAQIGQQLCLDVVVTPTAGDNNVSNNTATYCFAIVNSYDPNMKEVSPVNTIAPTEDWLTYTIHFQNMGNAPAIHIYVMDTLDNNLDESSIQILGSSHRMLTEIKGNIARFNFPNINLVDSTTNEPESKGWLQYKIKKNTGLALGTQIKNTASIYFDFNAPVVTNTVTNTVAEPSSIQENRNQLSEISVFPNPTNDVVYVSYSSITSAEVTLFNVNGAACLKQQLTASNQSISLSGLPSGVYFVSVEIEGSVVRKKVVKW